MSRQRDVEQQVEATAPKPELYSSHDAEVFKDPRTVAAYPTRPPYAQAAIEFLAELATPTDRPRRVLDVGCGTGDIARRLAPLADHVDAVDFSEPMIRTGRGLPGGDSPKLSWIVGAVEDAPLQPPYALVTAGESLHWMEWHVVLPRFARSLSPNGVLAIVGRDWEGPAALRERVRPILMRYSVVRWSESYPSLVDELGNRGLFTRLGSRRFGPEPWQPTVDEYLECRHSQRSFAHSVMEPRLASEFDDELRHVFDDLRGEGKIEAVSGRLELSVETTVTWGRPE